MNKLNLAGVFKSTQLWFDRHAPEILLGVGMATGFTATVLAVGATPKAVRLMEAKKEELSVDKLEPVEVVKTTWKCYIPAVMAGVSSVACLIGSHSVSVRRTAALAAAYQLSETALAEYKEKVIETIGEKKEQVVRDKVAKERAEKSYSENQSTIFVTGYGETLCLDYYSGKLFKSDIEKIRRAVNDLNRRMLIDNYVSLNDFYDELGLDHVGVGDDLGWCVGDGYIDVDFSAQLVDTEGGVQAPCVVLSYDVAPKYGYDSLS